MRQWSPENADMAGALPAMIRAARRARVDAKRHGTPLVIWQDGKIVHIPPEQIRVDEPADQVAGAK